MFQFKDELKGHHKHITKKRTAILEVRKFDLEDGFKSDLTKLNQTEVIELRYNKNTETTFLSISLEGETKVITISNLHPNPEYAKSEVDINTMQQDPELTDSKKELEDEMQEMDQPSSIFSFKIRDEFTISLSDKKE